MQDQAARLASNGIDPDGNRLEIYTDMMKVPEGEQFPRAEYADVFKPQGSSQRS